MVASRDGKEKRETLPPEGACLAGRYSLESRLAAGGMGAVYRATDTRDKRAVAVKVLHPELSSDPDLRRRFRRESSILTALRHPGIVRTLDVGTDEAGRCYTVMELLEGETLEARLASGPVSPEELVPIVRQVAGALVSVHEHGVVHGDIKPANLFLTDEGAKLVDFGLSKVHGLPRLTHTGEVIGTPAYMAPELLTGDAVPDGRIDIYALGVVLYEGLSGQKPFLERNPGRLLFDIVMGKGTPLLEAAPDVPTAVAEVVEKAMSASRDARYASSAELSEAFEQAVAG